MRHCTVHRQVTFGVKLCPDCDRLFCATCIQFGGLCAPCTRKANRAQAPMRDPREQARRRKPVTRRQRFHKGRKFTFMRWAMGLALLGGLGALLYFDYGFLVSLTQQAGKAPAEVVRKSGLKPDLGRDFEALEKRIEEGVVTEKDAAETEAMLKRITGE
ncbi:hypothetical protein J7643_05785 [bacterium]|nr:hypothetical protein [bacterium]